MQVSTSIKCQIRFYDKDLSALAKGLMNLNRWTLTIAKYLLRDVTYMLPTHLRLFDSQQTFMIKVKWF